MDLYEQKSRDFIDTESVMGHQGFMTKTAIRVSVIDSVNQIAASQPNRLDHRGSHLTNALAIVSIMPVDIAVHQLR